MSDNTTRTQESNAGVETDGGVVAYFGFFASPTAARNEAS
jgi:hypothetical protein